MTYKPRRSMIKHPTDTTYKIYYEQLDENGEVVMRRVHGTEYFTYGQAERMAEQIYGDPKKFRYEIARYDLENKYVCTDTCIICGEEYTASEDHLGARREGYSVTLTIWDNTENKKDRWVHTKYICPTCGEQLKKCIEENRK